MKKEKTIFDYEPLRNNRFHLTFTDGIDIEVWRIQKVKIKKYKTYEKYIISIFEIVKGFSLINKNLTNLDVSFTIEYFDPIGKPQHKECKTGIIIKQKSNNLNINKDTLIISKITVKIVT